MTIDLIGELEALVDALCAEGIDYALCGGLALAVHGYPRATKDIDLLVRQEDCERVRKVAVRLGFDLHAQPMTFGADTPNERKVLRVSKADPDARQLISLDLILVTPIFEVVWTERLDVSWRDRELVIVSRAGLAHMKRIAGRPQDLVDLGKLEGNDDQSE